MRILILLTALIFTSLHLFGQQVKIVKVNDLDTDISGTTIEVVGDKEDIDIHSEMRVINQGTTQLFVKYIRYREVNSGRGDQVCDGNLCYNIGSGIDEYITLEFDTLFPSIPRLFKPQILPAGKESCAVHNYMIVGENNEIYDSIRVIFRTTGANCILSTDKHEDLQFSIFPNPAKETVTISGESIKNGGTVVFLDALGKEVKRSLISSANNQIDVSTLRRGVYFVNIIDHSGTKSTVQRLIKQ